MAIKYNGVNIKKIVYNGVTVEKVIYNDVLVFTQFAWRPSDEGFYNSATVQKTAIDPSLSSDVLPVPEASGWGGMVAESFKPLAHKAYYESYRVN